MPVFCFDYTMGLSDFSYIDEAEYKYNNYIEAKPEFFDGLSLFNDDYEDEIKKIKISNISLQEVDEWGLEITYENGEIKKFNMIEYNDSFDFDGFLDKLITMLVDNIDLSKYMIPGLKKFIETPVEKIIDGVTVHLSLIIGITE